jgi:hypothetical protein
MTAKDDPLIPAMLDLLAQALLQPIGLLVQTNDSYRLKVALNGERLRALTQGKEAMAGLSFRLGTQPGHLLVVCQHRGPDYQWPKAARLKELTKAWDDGE